MLIVDDEEEMCLSLIDVLSAYGIEATFTINPEEPWLTIQMDKFLERYGWLEAEIPTDAIENRTYALEDFYNSLIEEREPQTSGDDNLYTMPLTFALEESARSNEPKMIADYF